MENEKILVHDEVIDAAEKIVDVGFGKGFKVATVIGLTILVSGITYRYIVKPIVAKIKTRKEQQLLDDVVENVHDDEYDSDSIAS